MVQMYLVLILLPGVHLVDKTSQSQEREKDLMAKDLDYSWNS